MDVEQTLGNLIPSRSRKLLQEHSSVTSSIQIFLDIFLVNLSLYALVIARNDVVNEHYLILGFVTSLLMILIYKPIGLYRHNVRRFTSISRIIKAWFFVFLILMIYAFITKTTDHYSRMVISIWFFLGLFIQISCHLLFQYVVRRYGEKSATQKKVLLIGNHWIGRQLAERVNFNPWIHEQVIGYVSDRDFHSKTQVSTCDKKSNEDIKHLGNYSDIAGLIKMYDVKRVYLVLPMSEVEKIEQLYMKLMDENVDINWVPDIFGFNLLNHHVREISGIPVMALSETPLVGERALLKSMFDKLITSIALILLSPLMITTAIIVKLTSSGPVLFKQKRHGMDGEEFHVYKFRSMYIHQEKDGIVKQAQKGDSRITKIGQFIRRTSIDELPQLFNVLNGSMSLVGPRPHAIEHNDFYAKKIETYMSRHRIKPGITGLAQVNGCRGETETVDKMKKRVDFDLNYINHWSIILDIKIIIKTAFTLFSKEAY